MATSDVTFQDGLKHPYLLALVRWCLSSVWSTATILLHRLVATPVPQLKGPKQPKSRPASYDHLHPEPRVDCEVLYSPDEEEHTLDVIFVHGLYGSLGNTWRQGEWRTKYDKSPKKVPLRRPHSIPTCKCADEETICCSDDDDNEKNDEIDERHSKSDLNNEVYHRKPSENHEFISNNEINVNIVNDKNVKGHNDKKIQCVCDNNFDFSDKNLHNFKINETDKMKQKYLKNDTDRQKTHNGKIFKCDANIISNGEFADRHVNEKNIDFNIQNSKYYGNVEKYDTESAVKAMKIQNDVKTRPNYEINGNNIKNYEDTQKILPNENLFITEKFYNNTLLDDINGAISRYETQAQFVKDLYESSVREQSEVRASDCKCQSACEVGCGCACDDCYSPCWPRDWVRADHPGARVISINYTSDPYLWRPLWVKESKRLRLHERAEQMMSQLLNLGVGERPIIWVGHSKGGLFIKKMYCEAYEAYLKVTKDNAKEERSEDRDEQNTSEFKNDNKINHCRDKQTGENNLNIHTDVIENEMDINTDITYDRVNGINVNNLEDIHSSLNFNESNGVNKLNDEISELNNTNGEDLRNKETDEMNINIYRAVNFNGLNDTGFSELNVHINEMITRDGEYENNNNLSEVENEVSSDDNEERIRKELDSNGYISEENEEIKESLLNMDEAQWSRRADLWRNSAGFMFYSVPHRGSPLADIKTPITARSIELMEICKDCPLVLSLQARWRAASAAGAPAVRSVVETCRTLMSVLYLRIVSVDSADPGIGSLYGVDVDHREICKPSSRRCLLYRELMSLVDAALRRRGDSAGERGESC